MRALNTTTAIHSSIITDVCYAQLISAGSAIGISLFHSLFCLSRSLACSPSLWQTVNLFVNGEQLEEREHQTLFHCNGVLNDGSLCCFYRRARCTGILWVFIYSAGAATNNNCHGCPVLPSSFRSFVCFILAQRHSHHAKVLTCYCIIT